MIKILKPKVIGATFAGAVAGFVAQHALVKAMFMPQKRIEIGGFNVPVEGFFSKYQTNIAYTVDKAVNKVLKNPKLLPPIQKALTNQQLKDKIFDFIIKFIYETGDKKTINELVEMVLDKQKKEDLVKELKEFIAKILVEKTDKEVLGTLMANEGIKIFREVTSGTILEKFLSERVFASIANGISSSINKFIETKGKDKILDITFAEIDSIMEFTVPELLKKLSINDVVMRDILKVIYDAIILDVIPAVLDNVDFGDMAKSGILKIKVEKVYDFLNKRYSKAVLVLDTVVGLMVGSLYGRIASRLS